MKRLRVVGAAHPQGPQLSPFFFCLFPISVALPLLSRSRSVIPSEANSVLALWQFVCGRLNTLAGLFACKQRSFGLCRLLVLSQPRRLSDATGLKMVGCQGWMLLVLGLLGLWQPGPLVDAFLSCEWSAWSSCSGTCTPEGGRPPSRTRSSCLSVRCNP